MPAEDHAETLAAGRRLAEYMGGTLVLVTEGKEGLTLFDGSREEHLAPVPRQVYDVTGAGDTVLAAVSLALCSGASHAQAMHLAGVAASIVIGLAGTATVGDPYSAAALELAAARLAGAPPRLTTPAGRRLPAGRPRHRMTATALFANFGPKAATIAECEKQLSLSSNSRTSAA